MRYGYRCPDHGTIDSIIRDDYLICPMCAEDGRIQRARRDWRFTIDDSFEPYYAPSFGQVIKSKTHARDLAKIASETQTLRTGIEHDYTLVETHDDAAVGIDTAEKIAATEETRRRAVNGAAWNAKRLREIKDIKDAKRAARDALKAPAE